MARHASIASHIATLLGTAVVATNPVAGGDICVATRARLSDGRSVFVKARPGAPIGFFSTEAFALTWLAAGCRTRSEPGAGVGAEPRAEPDGEASLTPAVLGYNRECLVLEWIEGGRPSPEAAEHLGRALARTHRSGAERFGAAVDGFIGTLSLPNTQSETWPEFFAVRRIEPYLRIAFNRGHLDAVDANAVCAVLERAAELAGPPEPPARIHGDLWSGNVVWAVDGMPRLVDAAAHGGHRETDLAMLALFGVPYLDRLLGAYQEVFPLAEGWKARAPLHQLHPLLVHAAAYGGGYGPRAGRVARDLLVSHATATTAAAQAADMDAGGAPGATGGGGTAGAVGQMGTVAHVATATV